MKARNLSASVHRRLLNRARATGRPFSELLQHYAMERFLYRLSCSKHASHFVLKGALLLRLWGAPVARPTLDIDLLGRMRNDPDAIAQAIRDICGQSVALDGLEFAPASVAARVIVEEADYPGVRVRFRGTLGTARISMQVDVGFGDLVTPPPAEIEYPTLLELPCPKLLAYPRETTLAEKFQVMLHRGLLNSRLRDYFDVWLLSRHFEFDGRILADAIRATCKRRGTEIPAAPAALAAEFAEDAAKQAQWRAFVRKSQLAEAPAALPEILRCVTEFLGPISAALAEQRGFSSHWHPPGPWRFA